MSFNSLTQLIQNGFNPEEILALLKKNSPSISKKIKNLIIGGWGLNEVLSYLQKDSETQNINFKNFKPTSPEEVAQFQAYQGKQHSAKSRDEESRQNLMNFTKQAATYAPMLYSGGSALSQYALSRSVPKAVQSLVPEITQSVGPVPPTPPPSPQTPSPIQPQPTSPISPPIPQNMKNLATKETSNAKDIFSKHGFTHQLDHLIKKGTGTDLITAFFNKNAPNKIAIVEKESGRPFRELVDEYVSQQPIKDIGIKAAFETMKGGSSTKQLYEGVFESLKKGKDTFAGVKDPLIAKAKPYFDKGLIKSAEDLKKFANEGAESLEKSFAALRSGQIGEIEEVKNGIAKVNVDGQIKHRKLSELIQEPEEIRNAIHEIMQIPESERSAVMDFANYDSKDKRLYIQFPTGKTVVYLDVEPDIASAIRESKGIPKTSGETKTGERWMAGVPDSRGAEFIARIKSDPKYSKANEGKTWYYLEDIYDKYGKLRLKPKKKR